MTWFFAILVVALMGGAAVVAIGRGGSMAEAYDDRPDSRVPADGPLGPADLRAVRFSTAFRGYRMSEVDALLDRLAADLEPARAPMHGLDRFDGPEVAGGPGGAGPVADGPVADGPVADGPVADGPVADGPVADGPVADGPVADGPARPQQDA
jgi:DivIVA domain-containing protein